ncbi:MAG: EamA family transporter [Ostreibacterium sp.]
MQIITRFSADIDSSVHSTTPVLKYSLKMLWVVIYIAVFASIIAQIAYAKGVSLIGANRAGFAINLVPVFGSLLAVVILREHFHWYHFSGLILVLGGIALSERFSRRFS